MVSFPAHHRRQTSNAATPALLCPPNNWERRHVVAAPPRLDPSWWVRLGAAGVGWRFHRRQECRRSQLNDPVVPAFSHVGTRIAARAARRLLGVGGGRVRHGAAPEFFLAEVAVLAGVADDTTRPAHHHGSRENTETHQPTDRQREPARGRVRRMLRKRRWRSIPSGRGKSRARVRDAFPFRHCPGRRGAPAVKTDLGR